MSKIGRRRPGVQGKAGGTAQHGRRSGSRLGAAAVYLTVGMAVLALAGALFLLWGGDRPGGGSGSDAPPALAPGQPAPPFDLPAAGGGAVSLPADAGGRPVLLYFSMGPG